MARALIALGFGLLAACSAAVDPTDDVPVLPPSDAPLLRAAIVSTMTIVNDRVLTKWPSPGDDIDVLERVPSHTWTRAVYFEGLMALHGVSPEPRYADYATRWADSHAWGLASGPATRFADDQCAGQTYLDLYALDPRPERLRDLDASVAAMVASTASDDWTWVDALQMAMPLFARLGVLHGDTRYFDRMYALYIHSRDVLGLYDTTDHLWWRDALFKPPFAEPNGAHSHWARGNGWAYAGLARVLDVLPAADPHRAIYERDFVDMSRALLGVMRSDGFWNVSLQDPTHFGGRELTGTALVVYGMAWGVKQGLLPAATYAPVVTRSWNAMARDAVHRDGALGYVQGTGAGPSDRMPVSADSVPNAEDFAVGCFLLAGSAAAKLAEPRN